jgi:hypothetical protein
VQRFDATTNVSSRVDVSIGLELGESVCFRIGLRRFSRRCEVGEGGEGCLT